MKFVALKTLILCALLAISLEAHMKSKKLSLSRLRTRKLKRRDLSAPFLKGVEENLGKYGLIIDKRIGTGSFGSVFSLKGNPNLIVRAFEYKHGKFDQIVKDDVKEYNKIKSQFFTFPICKAEEIQNSDKPLGILTVLHTSISNLFLEASKYYDKYLNKSFMNKAKAFMGAISADKDKKRYNKFKPKLEQFVQMALGLKEFHTTGLVHTQIELKNYLILNEQSNSGRVVLSNFGLATQEKRLNDSPKRNPGYIPYDIIENHGFVLNQEFDTYGLGIAYLNLTIPQYFSCFNEKKDCKHDNFGGYVLPFTAEQRSNHSSFLNNLNFHEGRKVSRVQGQVDDLVINGLLTENRSRLSSENLVERLKEIVPEVFEDIKSKFGSNPVNCYGLQEVNLNTNAKEEIPAAKEEIPVAKEEIPSIDEEIPFVAEEFTGDDENHINMPKH